MDTGLSLSPPTESLGTRLSITLLNKTKNTQLSLDYWNGLLDWLIFIACTASSYTQYIEASNMAVLYWYDCMLCCHVIVRMRSCKHMSVLECSVHIPVYKFQSVCIDRCVSNLSSHGCHKWYGTHDITMSLCKSAIVNFYFGLPHITHTVYMG